MNWRGRPLVSHEVIVELIGATTTHTGLRVRAELDRGRYPLGVKVSDEDWRRCRLCGMSFTASGTTPCVLHRSHTRPATRWDAHRACLVAGALHQRGPSMASRRDAGHRCGGMVGC
jgi:Rhodopirellula transposase DDE domain